MTEKIYAYFVVNDRWHCKESIHFCVYGTRHEIVQFQWMKMAELAEKWGRRFNPFDEFQPYDWNLNQVYCVWLNWWAENEKRPSAEHGYRFEDISVLVA